MLNMFNEWMNKYRKYLEVLMNILGHIVILEHRVGAQCFKWVNKNKNPETGMKAKDPEELFRVQKPLLVPISCFLKRLLHPRPSLSSKEQAQAITNEENKWRNAEK